MQFRLLSISGYAASIISVRMSQGKYYTYEKAQEVYEVVGRVTDHRGFMHPDFETYQERNLHMFSDQPIEAVLQQYNTDVARFNRWLTIVFENAMYLQDHHTLMKYIDFEFVSEGLHRGAQDDLDAHAPAFNNRITRFSTRLANIEEPKLSEWYQDKVIPFNDAFKLIEEQTGSAIDMPAEIETDKGTFKLMPFGYMLEKYHDMSHENGLYKDVQRGLIGLGHPGNALWKIDIFNYRYVYFRRSKLTKANPELRIGMEQLADQLEQRLPVFGPYIRKVFTDDKQWEHMNRTKVVSKGFYEKAMKLMDQELEDEASELT